MYTALIVSDQPLTAEGFRANLAPFRFQVETCLSVAEAQELVLQKGFNLLVVDQNNRMDGVTLVSELRDSDHTMPCILHQTEASTAIPATLDLARFCAERGVFILAGCDRESPEVFREMIERLFPGSREKVT